MCSSALARIAPTHAVASRFDWAGRLRIGRAIGLSVGGGGGGAEAKGHACEPFHIVDYNLHSIRQVVCSELLHPWRPCGTPHNCLAIRPELHPQVPDLEGLQRDEVNLDMDLGLGAVHRNPDFQALYPGNHWNKTEDGQGGGESL